jgi:myo-inositol-1-phosphate synthase
MSPVKHRKIRIAVVGVGNCSSALLQGINYYRHRNQKDVPGVMYPDIGEYAADDIEVVAAFDVDKRKVGIPIREAIFSDPNNTTTFHTEIDDDTVVEMGIPLDGIAAHMADYHEDVNFKVSNEPHADITRILKDREVDIVVNYLPVGSQKATEFYVNAAIQADVAFLNCIPVFIASNPVWEKRFVDAGLPIIGDDMKSQFGASILSQILQETLFNRGHSVEFHQQLNVGGNSDFANMMDQSRLASKKISKENVIRSQNDIRGIPVPKDGIYAGPSTFIPYLKDNKVAYIKVLAKGFGGAPVEIDCKLSVQDSPNSAGVVIDAIRFLKVAREMGIVGSLRGPSAWTQKTPPKQMTIEDAKLECDALAYRSFTDLTERQHAKNI